MKNSKTYLYLNGKAIGYIENPSKFVEEVRKARRSGKLSGEINISYLEKIGELRVNTDRGRIRKPYIIVENGVPNLTPELISKVKNG